MLILRIVVGFTVLLLVGLGVAFAVTRDRKYLRIAWRALQVVLLMVVAFALLYVFERVLLG